MMSEIALIFVLLKHLDGLMITIAVLLSRRSTSMQIEGSVATISIMWANISGASSSSLLQLFRISEKVLERLLDAFSLDLILQRMRLVLSLLR